MAKILTDASGKAIMLNSKALQSTGLETLDKTVTFMNDGSVFKIETVKAGEYIEFPAYPTKKNYWFKGWTETEGSTTRKSFPFVPTANITLYPIYEYRGAIPSEYQEVEYIQTDGNSAIASDTIITSSVDIYIKCHILNDAIGKIPIALYDGSKTFYMVWSYEATCWNFNEYRTNGGGIGFFSWAKPRTWYQAVDRTFAYSDWVPNQWSVATYSFSASCGLGFGQRARSTTPTFDGYGTAIRFYEIKLWDNDVLTEDYVPCYRKSDSVPGFYNLVTNTFKTNQATGSFIVGADVN